MVITSWVSNEHSKISGCEGSISRSSKELAEQAIRERFEELVRLSYHDLPRLQSKPTTTSLLPAANQTVTYRGIVQVMCVGILFSDEITMRLQDMLDIEFFVGSYTENGDKPRSVFGKYRDDAPGFDVDRSSDVTYMERCNNCTVHPYIC